MPLKGRLPLRVRSNEDGMRLKDRLKIDSIALKECRVMILRDCLDQTVLDMEFLYGIKREWVERLGRDSAIAWFTDSMFVIDKEYYYRIVGVVGRPNLNVQFRLSAHPSAWDYLKGIIADIIQRY